MILNTSTGAWKFRQYRTHGDQFAVTDVDLIDIAIELVNRNPGGGVYCNVFIRSTSQNELGIYFIYQVSRKELDEPNEVTMRRYEDFFQRRHGAAFKGYDIGHSMTRIILVNDEASSS